ncbi:hypothetical protein F4805DRAFT_172408 [Annulohypoxylon moriforme]|nr:hypothetical protein F4805DRAFT_172408 [Annulohypoxylon moriforme]
MESRVGKVPGIRAKRKQAANHEPHRPPMRGSISDRSSTSNLTPSELSFQHSDSDPGMEWATGWHLDPPGAVGTNFSDSSSNIHVTQNASTEGTSISSESATALNPNDDFSMTMDVNLDDLLMPHQSMSPGTQHVEDPPTTGQVLISLGLRPRNEVDSQCCLEACQIISDMENYIMADLKAFRIILGIVRKALEKLTHLMGLQQGSRNLRCLMLFTTLMYQVLELLEACLSTVAAEEERQRNRSLTSGLTGLGFGDFSIDAEEQSAFRTQTILKEIQQTTEVLGKLRTLAGVGPDSGSANGSQSAQGKARGDCYLDLEIRLRDLATRCARKR